MRRVVTIVMLLAIGLWGSVLGAPRAFGAPGETFSEEFAEVFTSKKECGFKVEFSFVGSVTVTEFLDAEGNVTRLLLHGEDVGSATNPANGKTATGDDHWLERHDVETGEMAIIGLFFHLNFGGAGIVVIDAGKVVFDADGNVIFLAGPHQVLEGDFAALCEALA